MPTLRLPQCALCSRVPENAFPDRCEAFPDGIPAPVLENRLDHRKRVPGDHGLRFLPVDPAAAKAMDDLFRPRRR